MHIAQVSLQFGTTSTGGGGVHVERVTEYLHRMGHQVTVLSCPPVPSPALSGTKGAAERSKAEGPVLSKAEGTNPSALSPQCII